MFESSEDIMLNIAKRFKALRRSKKISQMDLAATSKVSYGSIKRFELTGEISLNSLIKLCITLNVVDEINKLFN